MSGSAPPSDPPSRTSTPNPRFTSQASTAEDLLKSQTVGLVHLSDFRKRRAEALEQKQREAHDRSLGRFTAGDSGTATPASDGASTPSTTKKKKRKVAAGKLSFGVEDGEDEASDQAPGSSKAPSEAPASSSQTPEDRSRTSSRGPDGDKKRLGPNASVSVAPRVMTKSALLREAQTREQLRKEFLAMQEAVKATEVAIPFVFYDGTNIPGGVCRVKKGDFAWLFLDKARKVGAELGVAGGGASGERTNTRREWARVGVDDLMLVREEIIIPHHYDFYYFIVNQTRGPSGRPLFDFSADAKPLPTTSSPSNGDPEADFNPLSKPGKRKQGEERLPAVTARVPDADLEGHEHDPTVTKVVDRRWYERNKHIFPASVWEEFEPVKNYASAVRRDTGGNAFFFA